ncbi:head GIN domain-containing protein [Salegentibacter sp. T436]|uniref:head GIN domain-containing protein n=1 Tax=Salegentibacter sp. T436 TaxID=1729720 RepID=UPI00094A8D93|nr:head GIN domain-containing protein [Salegentibacter sp. T436]APS40265.1 adhesin [Salegentibacter sp. T436]|tara:strand:+ start:661 stop:1404 length:744 start_codon:yes stop_codon:yes gene_type:complete
MQNICFYFTLLLLSICNSVIAQEKTSVDEFDKVIISPHIQVSFVEGNEEAVTIENITEREEKLNIEVKNKTLRVYLDDAKEFTKKEKLTKNGRKMKKPIYKGTVVTAVISYKTLKEMSLRGEENIVCESPLKENKFRLKIYGESTVTLNEVDIKRLRTSIYGESILNIKAGKIMQQKIRAYGASTVNALEAKTQTSKITAYGESDFFINATEEIKITAYGEASLEYKGNPEIKKGLVLGGLKINRSK